MGSTLPLGFVLQISVLVRLKPKTQDKQKN